MNAPILPQLPIIKSVTDLRYKAREIMARVINERKTVLLTRDSDPVAVLFPVDLYEAVRQYIEDMQDTDILKAELAKKEKTTGFGAFDKIQRQKRKLPAYVPDRSSK